MLDPRLFLRNLRRIAQKPDGKSQEMFGQLCYDIAEERREDMEWQNRMQRAIDYLEEHLTEEICW